MSFPPVYRKAVDHSGPNHHDFDVFKIKEKSDSKTLFCTEVRHIIMWDYDEKTVKASKAISGAQCMEKCMADADCKKITETYLKRGYKFKTV
jgi:hypothetical protein